MRKIIMGALLLWPLFIHGQARPPAFVQEVFDRLIAAYGRSYPTAPALQITPVKNVIAEAKADGTIYLGSQFVEMCRSMGADSANALAVVLSHELAHYYNHHFWAADYGSAFANLDWGRAIDSLGQAKSFRAYYESQADDYGLFFSHVAGYQTFAIAPTVYKTIYNYFDLPDKLPGYPALEERMAIAEMAAQRIEQMAPLFHTGKYLYILASGEEGEYRQQLLHKALQCYETLINQRMVNRTMYNDAGIIYLQSALSHLDPKAHPFVYPILLDDDAGLFGDGSAATAPASSGYGENELIASSMLRQAIRQFDHALDLDPAYGVAYLNMAIAYHLLEDSAAAHFYIYRASTLANANKNQQLMAFCKEMTALMNANDKEAALNMLSTADSLGSPSAVKNASILRGTPDRTVGGLTTGFGFGQQETWQGKSLPEIYQEVWPHLTADHRMTVGRGSYLFSYPYQKGQVYIAECNERECPYTSLVMYALDNTETISTAKGVSIGTPVAEMKEKYGQPSTIVPAVQGQYYLYKNVNILFKTDPDGHVAYWVLFYYMM